MVDASCNGLWKGGWRGVLQQLLQRDASPPIQFFKYVVAGGTAVGVHTLVFFLAGWFLLPALDPHDIVVRVLGLSVSDIDPALRARNAMINTVPAFLISNMVAYLINVAWVFHPGRYKWYVA